MKGENYVYPRYKDMLLECSYKLYWLRKLGSSFRSTILKPWIIGKVYRTGHDLLQIQAN